ncbi:MAG: hypothetical protein ONB23_00385 [candidate division KSB1 bacterium]|nr:hypothetical protein [candidate division KSB1 bacterium]
MAGRGGVAILTVLLIQAGGGRVLPSSSVVLRRPCAPQKEFVVSMPRPPGFLRTAARLAPSSQEEAFHYRSQLLRVAGQAAGRWIPDTTSFSSLCTFLNRLPKAQRDRVLAYGLLAPAAFRAQHVVRRLWGRWRLPLLEPAGLALRLKPLRPWSRASLTFELRLNHQKVGYLRFPAWRTSVYCVRAERGSSYSLWRSLSRTYALALAHYRGVGWQSVVLVLNRNAANSVGYVQLERVREPGRGYWSLMLTWSLAWVPPVAGKPAGPPRQSGR